MEDDQNESSSGHNESKTGDSPLETPEGDSVAIETGHPPTIHEQEHVGQSTEPISNQSDPATNHMEALLESGITEILNAFEQKLAYDTTKQQQIDSLHEQLQKHRSDLIARTNRPLVNGLIRLHDDVGKLVESLEKKPLDQLDPERFFKEFRGIQEDMEILLDQNGIVAFTEPVEQFEPRRQRVIKRVETSEQLLVGTIAKQLRPGFEQADDLIQKERVWVYVQEESTAEQDAAFRKEAKTNVSDTPETVTPRDSEHDNDG